MNKKFYGKYLVRLFWMTTLLSIIAWFIALVVSPQGSQLNLFFLRMGDFWADATNTTGYVSDLDPYYNIVNGLQNHNYPPLAYVFYYLLAHISISPLEAGNTFLTYYYQPIWTMVFIIILFLVLISFYIVCENQFKSGFRFDAVMIIISLLFSGPMLFAIERGNIIIVSALAVAVYIFYYDSSCKLKKEIALVSLAVATAIKLSPLILGVLLIYKKDWWAIGRLVVYGLIFMVPPFFLFNGGINNISQMISNIRLWFLYYPDTTGIGIVSSCLKYAKLFWGDAYCLTPFAHSILNVLRGELSLILLLGAFNFNEKWKVVLNATLILLIFPKVTGYYCILYIIPFTVLFFKTLLEKMRVSIGEKFVVWALMMIFFTYQCNVQVYLNVHLSVIVLTVIGITYSIGSFIKTKHIFPLNYLGK